jgi:hypothetical protein
MEVRRPPGMATEHSEWSGVSSTPSSRKAAGRGSVFASMDRQQHTTERQCNRPLPRSRRQRKSCPPDSDASSVSPATVVTRRSAPSTSPIPMVIWAEVVPPDMNSASCWCRRGHSYDPRGRHEIPPGFAVEPGQDGGQKHRHRRRRGFIRKRPPVWSQKNLR